MEQDARDIEQFKWRMAIICDNCTSVLSPCVTNLDPSQFLFKDLAINCPICGSSLRKAHGDILFLGKPASLQWFEDTRRRHALLAHEVVSALQIALATEPISVLNITWRAKEFSSFMDKVHRKQADKPFVQISDVAGVRVVHHLRRDRSAIEKIVTDNFDVLEKVKSPDVDAEGQFGYAASHYIVKLGRHISDDKRKMLGGLKCEIQIRTVLEDAWAEMSHHLTYKRAQVPKDVSRAMKRLAAQVEACDVNFDEIAAKLPVSKRDPRLPTEGDTVVFPDKVWEDKRALPQADSVIRSLKKE